MNKQYDCNIIFDLLPLYIDKMTSEGTSRVVESHLATCENCRQIYEAMSGEIDISLHSKKKKRRRHLYKKKSIGRMLILGYILFLLLIMAFCVLDIVLFI